MANKRGCSWAGKVSARKNGRAGNSAWGTRMRRIKGARYAHRAMRAAGTLGKNGSAVAAARKHMLRMLREGLPSHEISAKLNEMGFGRIMLRNGDSVTIRAFACARAALATPFGRAKLKFATERSESHPLYAMANRWDMTPGKHVSPR